MFSFGSDAAGDGSGVFVDLVYAAVDDHEHVAQVVCQPGAGTPDQLAPLRVVELAVQQFRVDLCSPFDFRVRPFGVASRRGPEPGPPGTPTPEPG